MIIKKDSEIVKAKVERKSLALKAKKESSDEECLTSDSEYEEYAMAVRDFKKFFKKRECPKPPKDKNQRAFVGGSWSDSGEEDDEKVKNKMSLVAQASSENMSPENNAHYEPKKEAIHLILTGIGGEIYSTVDACKTTQEMWEAIERFYKMMTEMIRNNLTVATMQVNVQFLQQLQPEWSRIARTANPLVLVATAQSNQDPYYQTPKSHKPNAPTSKASIPNGSHATTINKDKKIAKPIIPPSESVFEEDSDPEQAQRDKDMNDNQSEQFGNQRTMTVAEARKNVEKSQKGLKTPRITRKICCCANKLSKVFLYKQSNLTGYADEEIDEQELEAHYSYMAKIQEVPTADSGTDSEPLEQVQNNDEFNMFANVNQHCEQSGSTSNTCLVEKDDSDVNYDSPDMCENDIQTDQNAEDERAALANLIVNLKLDVDENKKIQKQLKKANASLTQELTELKSILVESSRTLREAKGNQDSRRRDSGYNGNKARDNDKRPAYQDDSKALVTMDGEDIDWSGHVEEDTQNYAMMDYSSSNSGSDNELAYKQKIRFMKIDLDDKTDVLAYHKKLVAEALKEKEDLKTKVENWKNSFKNLSRLLNTQMSVNDKFGLGHGDYIYGSILNYENKVLQSAFMNKECDLEDTPINDRYAKGMHVVPPPMIGNYMPFRHDVEINYSKFTYGLKQTSVDESYSKTCENAACESDSSVETTTSNPALVENAPKIVCKPKVWTDAPIIEEYESDSDDDSVSNAQENIETPSFSFTNSVKHVKSPRGNIKEIGTPNHYRKVMNMDRNGHTKKGLDDPHKALKDKGIIDSRCSRHMTGNKAHLADYQEFKGGSVAFGGSNGRMTGKRKLKAGRVLVTKPQNKTPYELLNGRQPIISYLRPFGYHVTILNTIDHLGKYDGKSDSGFLVGYSLNSKAFRVYNLKTKRVEENPHVNFLENKPNVAGKGHAWMFDLDYLTNSMNYKPVSLENQANKSAGPKEANYSAGTQANADQGANLEEIDLHDEHFVMPIWSAYSTTVKSLGTKTEKTTDCKTCEKPASQVEQIFQEEIEKLKRQEKESNDAVRKEITHENQNANNSSTNLLNVVSTPISTTIPSITLNDGKPSYPDDPSMPHLTDIYASLSEKIFTDSSYDDEGVVTDFNNLETIVTVSLTPTTRIHTIHPKTQILGYPVSVVQTRSKVHKNSEAHALVSYIQKQQGNNHKNFQHCLFASFLSQVEPKKISQALEDKSWVDAMQEELNKKDERGVLVRNKARFVAQGHRKEEGIDYDEAFAHVARIESIRIFLAFASYMGFIVYQMDVKSTFLYGTIDEEVYVIQPPGFVDPKFPNMRSGYRKGAIDKTLSIKQDKKDIMLVQVYGDDIIFGSIKKSWCDEFEELMKNRFQMSSMGELTFFLRLQTASTPFETQNPLVKDKEAADVDVHLYRFMIGSLMYLTASRPDIMFTEIHNRRLSWQCKKQTIVATSTIEAEYVAAAHCCGQVLWNNQLLDYGFNLMNTKIYIDNESKICIVKNPVFHSKTKHIEIRHHFIRDAYEKKLIQAIVSIKKVKDVVKLQSLIDSKKVIITEDIIRQDLRLDDVKGVDCLPTEEIFAELARMGYEKPPLKLTSYKAFFSAQWKFLIHTLFQCMSAKRTAWNKFSSSMASTSICLATGRKFNFSKYIFDNMVRNVDSPSKFLMIGIGFSGIETPLFSTMLVQPQAPAVEEEDEVEVPSAPTPPSPTTEPSPPLQEPILTHPQAQPTPPSSPPQEQPTTTSTTDMNLLNTFLETCTTLSHKVVALEQDKRLRKVGGRIKDIDADEEITLVDIIQDNLGAELQGRLEEKDEVNVAAKEVNAAEPTFFDDEEMQEKHLDNISKYQSLKRKPIFVAQAKKNMIVYLKNMAGYKIAHFKGMTYDQVRPIFEREYNKVQTFLKPDRDKEPTNKRGAEETLLQKSFKKLRAEVEVLGSHSTHDTSTDDPTKMSEEDVKNIDMCKYYAQNVKISQKPDNINTRLEVYSKSRINGHFSQSNQALKPKKSKDSSSGSILANCSKFKSLKKGNQKMAAIDQALV
nr:hypothetical protein [Tanacetum cinerariifolium]